VNDVALLPIPENYYEDLEAKTDLFPAIEIDVYGHLHSLYERDWERGVLQLYSRLLHRFFLRSWSPMDIRICRLKCANFD